MGEVTLSEVAAALIAVFEGCRLTAYRDSGGVLTIGYGHTGPDVQEGSTITRQRAEELLAQDQAHLFAVVAGKPILEAAALVSFGYNCGAGSLSKVLAGHDSIGNYIRDRHGNVLEGLERRRNLEETLCLLSQQITSGR